MFLNVRSGHACRGPVLKAPPAGCSDLHNLMCCHILQVNLSMKLPCTVSTPCQHAPFVVHSTVQPINLLLPVLHLAAPALARNTAVWMHPFANS